MYPSYYYFLGRIKVKAIENYKYGPDWCGSADWEPASEPKGHGFDSPSRLMPGLQASSLVGGIKGATTH